MRIAILPVEKEENQIKNKFTISTEIAYIITYLEHNNPEDVIYPACDLEFLYKTKPDIVCIYAPYSFTFEDVIKISNSIKENLDIPVILSGDHISSLPKTLPLSCNAGILGDPEETFKEIIELKRNDNLNEKSLSKIPGIVFNFKNQKVITDKPQFIKNIDELPMTRGVFYDMPGEWLPSLMTGRGKATVNAWQPLSTQPVRLFSIERMITDIADLIANNQELKVAPIKDYLFLYDKARFKKFIEMYIDTNLIKYMSFNVKALISQLDEEIIYDLKHVMKIPKLTIQFLSPLEKFYKEIKDEFVPLKKQKELLDLCFKYNLNIEAKFMYNMPNETIEDTTKTYWYIKRNYINKYENLDIEINPLSVLPGTELWHKGIFKKAFTESFNNWNSLDRTKFDENTPYLSSLKENINIIKESFKNLTIKKNNVFNLNVQMPDLDEFRYISTNVIKSSVEQVKEMYPERDINTEEVIHKIFNVPVPKIDQNLFFTLEELLNSDKNISDLKIPERIKEIKVKYTENKTEKFHNLIYNSNNINYFALEAVLQEIVQNTKIKNVLQVCNKNILDLKKIFKNDYLDVDTLEPEIFNKPVINFKTDKKYDMILLYFTMDIIADPDKTIDFCKNILNDKGVIIIPFYNSKNIIAVTRLLTELNLNNLFFGYKRTNFYTLDSFNNFILKHNFLVKSIDSVDYPGEKNVSATEKVFNETLKTHLNKNETEKMFYIFVCRNS